MKKTIGVILATLAVCIPVFYQFGRPFTRPIEEDMSQGRLRADGELADDRETPHRIDVAMLFDQPTVERIRKDPELAAELFDRFQKLPALRSPTWLATLSNSERAAVFCCILSHAMAPYDNSLAREFDALLQEKHLDCDNYALLTRHFFNLVRKKRGLTDLRIAFVGWEGDAVGNHAQMFTHHEGRSVLLDPTVGMIALCDFDSVAAGKQIPMGHIIDFAWRKKLGWYSTKIADALHNGRYRPSHLFYYYVDFERFLHGPASFELYDTPGAVRLREHVREMARKRKSTSRN